MKLPENVYTINAITNHYEKNPNTMINEANRIVAQCQLHNIVKTLVLESLNLNLDIMITDENKNIAVYSKSDENTPIFVTPDEFTDLMITNPEGLGRFMTEYLIKSPNAKKLFK